MEQAWNWEAIARYWDLMGMVASLAFLALSAHLWYRFFKPYVPGRLPAAAAGITYTAVMLMLYFIPWEMMGMLAYGIGALAAFCILYGMDPEKLRQKLFLSLTMYLLDWIAHGIVGQIRSLFFWSVLDTPFIKAEPMRHFYAYVVVESACVVIRYLCVAALIWIFNRIYVCKDEDMDSRELVLMLAAPLLVLAGYGTFVFIADVYEADLGRYIWDANPSFSTIKICYQLLSYPVIVIQLAFYQSIKDSRRKEMEAAVLAGQLADMEKHIHEVEGLYREIRGLKHEMGNHIMTIEQLVLKNQREETAAYIRSWRQQQKEAVEPIKTGNPVTDVVLAEKRRKAREQGVDLACEFFYPPGAGLDAFDISILLNNALDNAIEAAEGCPAPAVRLRSWRRKNVYMIEVQNPFAGTLMPDGDSGLFRSTKEGREHGFGLANMRKVAQSYMGDIEARTEEGVFVLTVMLMVE